MESSRTENQKEQVRKFWESQSCDTQMADAEKFSQAYFEEIEAFRYRDQPFIHSFAQFSRYRGKRILEVGFGAGSDFIQWLRSGARVSGIDLTTEALANVSRRIAVYGLPAPERIETGDAEHLPFETGVFDLAYSFGVLHHSPNTEQAIRELIRVAKPGGEIKVMLYNRRSICAVNVWVKHALLKGMPWRTIRWVLSNYAESMGTKAYTRSELGRMFADLPLEDINVETVVTSADYLAASFFPPLNWIYRAAITLAGRRHSWHPAHYVERCNSPDRRWVAPGAPPRGRMVYTGNAFGFFHCISARKKGLVTGLA